MSFCNSNGRVDILGDNVMDRFHLYDKIPVRNNTSYNDALQGNWSQTALSKAFFDNHRRFSNSTVWIIPVLSNGINVIFFSKGHITCLLESGVIDKRRQDGK